jgi:cytochrome bd-type quinol oxidase subunit 2
MESDAMNFRNCHLLVGGLGLFLFALQGQYMARVLGVEHLADASRMLYRSAHIYFLLSCVANVGVGYYMPGSAPINFLQRLISVILLASPVLLVVSFLTESTADSLDRPVATVALYLLFGAATLLLLHELYRRLRGGPKRV